MNLAMRKIPLIKPYITESTKAKVMDVLDSGFLTEGSVTRNLEKEFCEYIKVEHALAFTSCTTGLEVALRALNIGPGDEVIVPSYTYPATANVVSIVGATPVIVDVDKHNMLIDYEQIELSVTDKTRAIIPVSLFGNPLDYNKLDKIKKKHNVYIVEDAACSIGSEIDGRKVGALADISVFSMHPRKFITTGEGGMLTTDNKEWAEWIFSYKHFGMSSGKQDGGMTFDKVGTNYKLSDVLSAIGLEQIKQVDKLLDRRIELAGHYDSLLSDSSDVLIPEITATGKHSYQSYCVYVENRDFVLNDLRSRQIEVQIGSYALHQLPAFAESSDCRIEGDMSGADYAASHALVLPLYHDLAYEDQVYVVEELQNSISRSK